MSSHIDKKALSSPEPEPSTSDIYDAASVLQEIERLTRHELTAAREGDSIVECGRAALYLLHANPDLAAKLAYQKLHDVPYKDVNVCWRRLYTDAALWRVLTTTKDRIKRKSDDEPWLDDVVKLLDTTLILTAAPLREELVELWLVALEEELSARVAGNTATEHSGRPAKKLKLDNTLDNASPSLSTFPAAVVEPLTTVRHEIPRCENLSLHAFQRRLSSPAKHTPLIIQHAIEHWPALAERPWSDPNYLLKRTLGGRRLIPIETGRNYTDSGWGQSIITFKEFMSTYMLNNSSSPQDTPQMGYLAQHDLFAQIPTLRADISIPDICYCDTTPNPLSHIKESPKLEDPLLNAWFGPKGTISPLHTDPYHNILAQVVGYKYVRLYAPDQTKWLHPRSVDENGVDMSNTSLVDLDEAMIVFPEIGVDNQNNSNLSKQEEEDEGYTQSARLEFEARFPGFATAKYVEGILGPGQCLYIPPGWWHYVKSLSPSFSVSFWFN